jgi:molybdopterin/thiamine biosynthesis adenylyltransferase
MTFWERRVRSFRTWPVRALTELNMSQAPIEGFDLGAYQAAHVVMVGAGGIGSQVATALVRKGIGHLTLLDDDRVELKNLTRQLYCKHDVGKYKAVRLARHLTRDGLFPTRIDAHPRRFQELIERGDRFDQTSILICGVDNNPTRRAVAAFALARDIPVIHAAVSRDGNHLYVMVQKAAEACWGCAFPNYVNDNTYPCNLPGIIDVLQVVAGFVVFTVDTLICGRPRDWNVRQIYLDGSAPDRARIIERRPDCELCGARTS